MRDLVRHKRIPLTDPISPTMSPRRKRPSLFYQRDGSTLPVTQGGPGHTRTSCKNVPLAPLPAAATAAAAPPSRRPDAWMAAPRSLPVVTLGGPGCLTPEGTVYDVRAAMHRLHKELDLRRALEARRAPASDPRLRDVWGRV